METIKFYPQKIIKVKTPRKKGPQDAIGSHMVDLVSHATDQMMLL